LSLPAAVVFDFDGLMLDTEWSGCVSNNEVFRAHGEELDVGRWTSFVGTTDHPDWSEILAEQTGRAVDMERWGPWRAEDGMRRARNLDLLEGVGELADALGDAGVPLAVASSSRGGWVRTHLDHRGLTDRFAAICTGDEVERTKPDPALYLLACERLGVDPAGAVALEDSVLGVRSALAAGRSVVAVPGHMTAHMDFAEAHLVVASCADLDPGRLSPGRLRT
jgi:HAD superfamily hydrolase (TIGR01509 family)